MHLAVFALAPVETIEILSTAWPESLCEEAE
eukprot:SAG11_NODE_8554_length_1001_cov_0.990022_1_plen_30_part_10